MGGSGDQEDEAGARKIEAGAGELAALATEGLSEVQPTDRCVNGDGLATVRALSKSHRA